MPKNPSPSKPIIHFIGIGGIAVSALARWFLAENWAVSGSDRVESEITKSLRKEGVKVQIGHKKANLPPRASMVVYSPAIPANNPEIVAARASGIQPLTHAETIGCLSKLYKTIAIAGSHGKSTTTALTSLVLIEAKFDPTVVIGTLLKEFGGKNFRFSHTKKWLVVEADEWAESFLNYYPYVSVVTNIDKEHLDQYKNLANVKTAFLKFLNQTVENGFFVLNQSDPILFSLKSKIEKIAEKKNIQIFWYKENQKLKNVLKIPGRHNLSNATAVYTLAEKILKIKPAPILKALGSYTGAWRRMEFKGNLALPHSTFPISHVARSIPVYDDYAHHPTEIKASLQALREKFPKQKIICVYEPHQARRLKNLFPEFVDAFKDADILILSPVYEVAGRDNQNKDYTSQKLAAAILKKYPHKAVYYIPHLGKIKSETIKILQHQTSNLQPVIVMMGAGDIFKSTKNLLK